MSVKVIAEIGINHHGKISQAMTLIDQAHSAGCWGVKFQYRDIENFYGEATEIGDEILLSEIKRSHLDIDTLLELVTYAQAKSLRVGVSFFRKEDFVKLEGKLRPFDFFKVPSAECTNSELIQCLLDTGKHVMVSTGGHHYDEITKRNPISDAKYRINVTKYI